MAFSVNALIIGCKPAAAHAAGKKEDGRLRNIILSFPSQFWTQSAAPSGKPRLVRISSPKSDCLRVKWEDPDSDTWNGPLVAYKVGWREAPSRRHSASEKDRDSGGSSSSYNWTDVERHDSVDLQVVLPALKAYTRYELLIQAVNDVGVGPTEMANARTAGDGKLKEEVQLYPFCRCRGAFWSMDDRICPPTLFDLLN